MCFMLREQTNNELNFIPLTRPLVPYGVTALKWKGSNQKSVLSTTPLHPSVLPPSSPYFPGLSLSFQLSNAYDVRTEPDSARHELANGTSPYLVPVSNSLRKDVGHMKSQCTMSRTRDVS